MDSLLELAHERLSTQGGRMTAQRRFILEALQRFSGHPTAEDLFDSVRQSDPTLNLSTVYRTLRWLEQEGLVQARRFSGDQHHEHFDPVKPTEHHHFYCHRCERLIEFDDPAIQSVISNFAQRTGAAITTASLTLYGLCPACQASQESGTPA